MLTAAQRACLEAMLQRLDAELYLEAAILHDDETLELVLCRDFVCFRPLRIDRGSVDIAAALAGHAEAQQALQSHLHLALQGLLGG